MEGIHDIHNPPKERYVHQEFPKLVYREPKAGQHPHEAHKLVKDEDELAAALAKGYQHKPFVEPIEAVEEGEEEVAPSRRGRKKSSE